MRSILRAGARALLLPAAFCAGCERQAPPAPPPTPTTAQAAPVPAANALTGPNEIRKPEPFTLEQRLLEAVRRNDRASIEKCLEHGAKVQSKDDLGRNTAFLAVLDAGDLDLTRWLHEKGAPLDDPDVGGRTALSFAAAEGKTEIVRFLIENGADVNRADVQKRTPLFHAAITDRQDIATILLDRGVDVNAADQFGDTPLIVACAKGYGAMASLLLAHKADPALTDQEGRNARERAQAGTTVCLELPAK